MAAAAIVAAQFIMIWCANLAVRVDEIILGSDLGNDQEAAEEENQIKRESGRVEHGEEADEEAAEVEHEIAGAAEREDEAQQQESGEIEHQKTEAVEIGSEVETGSEFKGFVNKTIEEFDDFEASEGDPCALALQVRNFAGEKLSVRQTSTLYGGNLKFTYNIEIGKSIIQEAPDRHYNVGQHHSYDGMTEYFKRGTYCGRHGHREAKITYSFGDDLKLLSAKEPRTCRYEYKVQLPLASCVKCRNIWKPDWEKVNPDWKEDPDKACKLWEENDEWGALKNGQTLEKACKDKWATENCARTCGCQAR